jgi:hypothetical protein
VGCGGVQVLRCDQQVRQPGVLLLLSGEVLVRAGLRRRVV